jgi:arsenite-transporting ATPase
VPGLAALDRDILFFGGKGGVGKTTLAAAWAVRSAESGLRTLLVSTDPAHSTGDVLEATLGSEPQEVTDRLWVQEIDPAEEADTYIRDVRDRVRGTVPPRLQAEVDRQIDIARVTPGAEEAAVFDRVTWILASVGERYDRVLFDTAPLGYTLRLLSLPETMATWMAGLIGRRRHVNALARMWRTVAGSETDERAPDDPILTVLRERHQRFTDTRTKLMDAGRTGFVLVATPEHLAVAETERAVETLRRYAVPIAALVTNRVRGGGGEAAYRDRLRVTAGDMPRIELEEQRVEVRGVGPLLQLAAQLADGTPA